MLEKKSAPSSPFAAYQSRLISQRDRLHESLPVERAQALALLAIYEEMSGGHEALVAENNMRAFGALRSSENAIRVTNEKLRLARPSSETDIKYRQKVQKELAGEIQSAIPQALPLRFHGSPIYNISAIFADCGVSPARDRTGSSTSYDAGGHISVTAPETLQWTLDDYAGLSGDNYMLPAGCVFVLLPKSKTEAESSNNMQMSKFDFREQPEQLFAILTSDESLGNVKQMAADNGIDPAKVCEFLTFPGELSRIAGQLETGESQLEDLLPYELID